MKTYKIHLLRHGLSEGSTEGEYIGHTDVSLTEEGRHQLAEMKKDYEYPEVKAVISSPLNRCLETAKILYPSLSPMIFDNLIEYNFGEFEGMTADELKNEKEFTEWLVGGPEAATPFGESNRDFSNRVCGCFIDIVNGIIKSGIDNVAVITHGGVIMTIMAAFALPEMSMHEWMTPNGCGYTLNIMPSVWAKIVKAELSAEIPVMPRSEAEDDSDDGDWNKPFNAEDFIGFYSETEKDGE